MRCVLGGKRGCRDVGMGDWGGLGCGREVGRRGEGGGEEGGMRGGGGGEEGGRMEEGGLAEMAPQICI